MNCRARADRLDARDRTPVDEPLRVAEQASELKVPALALFPVTAPEAPTDRRGGPGTRDGSVPARVRALKARFLQPG